MDCVVHGVAESDRNERLSLSLGSALRMTGSRGSQILIGNFSSFGFVFL